MSWAGDQLPRHGRHAPSPEYRPTPSAKRCLCFGTNYDSPFSAKRNPTLGAKHGPSFAAKRIHVLVRNVVHVLVQNMIQVLVQTVVHVSGPTVAGGPFAESAPRLGSDRVLAPS
jgi:hypothetical protein